MRGDSSSSKPTCYRQMIPGKYFYFNWRNNMNDLIVSLPMEAVKLEKEILDIDIIQVEDDRTNIAASENLKIVSAYYKEFVELLEPKRVELRKPLDDFLSMKKMACDRIDEWIKNQKLTIGKYGQEIIRKENERKRLDLIAQNELRGEARELQPVTEARAHSEFVKSKVKEKPEATITDLAIFVSTLLSTGNIAYLKMIFDKPNISKLNQFCKLEEINGRDKNFPGLSVEMVPDIKII
jgi:hypothetical protein